MEIYHTTFEECHNRGGWSVPTPVPQQKSSLPQHIERKRQTALAEKKKKKVNFKLNFFPSFGPSTSVNPRKQLDEGKSDASQPQHKLHKIPRKAVPIRKSDIRIRNEKGDFYPQIGGDSGKKEKEKEGHKEDRRRQVSPPRSSQDLSSATSSPFYAHRLGHQAPRAPITHVQSLRRYPPLPPIPGPTQKPKPKSTPSPIVPSLFKPLPKPPRPVNNNTIVLDARNNYLSLPTTATPWRQQQPQKQMQTQKQAQNVKGHKKTNLESYSKRLANYIRTSADLFDETRREVTGRLSPSPGIGSQDHAFHDHKAHMPHPFSTSSNPGCENRKVLTPTPTPRGSKGKSKTNTKRDSTDSVLSFYCAGTSSFPILSPKHSSNTNTAAVPTKPLKNTKLLKPESAIRKTKYYSPSPGNVEKLTCDTDVEPRICRLCHVGLEGIMGLCRKCEDEFTRPASGVRPGERMQVEMKKPTPPPKDEVRPPVPLKVVKRASEGVDTWKPIAQAQAQVQRQTSRDSWTSSVESLIEGETSGLRLGSVAKGRTVIQPPTLPGRQKSHHIAVMDADEDERRYSRYQSDGMRTDAEQRQNDLTSWTAFYDNNPQAEYTQKRHMPKTANRFGDRDRDTNFYGFYDDILKQAGR